jgi:high-affinity Fe2+/Pb2+ permease
MPKYCILLILLISPYCFATKKDFFSRVLHAEKQAESIKEQTKQSVLNSLQSQRGNASQNIPKPDTKTSLQPQDELRKKTVIFGLFFCVGIGLCVLFDVK